MNSIQAKIVDLKTSGSFTLVELNAEGISLKTIVIDTPETSEYLILGQEIKVIFKETEVSLATKENLPVSLQNQIPGIIQTIKKGDLLSRIVLKTEVGLISSVITSSSTERLQLAEGQQIFALIKTNELMLSE